MGSDMQHRRSVSGPYFQILTLTDRHSTETWEVNGLQLYGKNVTTCFGRCPVRSIFEDALKLLVQEQKKVAFLCGITMSLEEAPKAFEDFEARKVHKIVFKIGDAAKRAGGEVKAAS